MKYKINKGFIVQKLDNKAVIFDGEKSVLYTFNDIAYFIFRKIKLGWEEQKIVTVIVSKYRVKETRIANDLKEIISDLKKKKIISALKPNR